MCCFEQTYFYNVKLLASHQILKLEAHYSKKRPLGRPRGRREDNIKMDLKEMCQEEELN